MWNMFLWMCYFPQNGYYYFCFYYVFHYFHLKMSIITALNDHLLPNRFFYTFFVIYLVPLFQVLAKGGVTYRDEPWHKECFLCTGCKVQLAGQHFTSRDDSPYCLKCFGNLYAKKCEACSKPITGTVKLLHVEWFWFLPLSSWATCGCVFRFWWREVHLFWGPAVAPDMLHLQQMLSVTCGGWILPWERWDPLSWLQQQSIEPPYKLPHVLACLHTCRLRESLELSPILILLRKHCCIYKLSYCYLILSQDADNIHDIWRHVLHKFLKFFYKGVVPLIATQWGNSQSIYVRPGLEEINLCRYVPYEQYIAHSLGVLSIFYSFPFSFYL